MRWRISLVTVIVVVAVALAGAGAAWSIRSSNETQQKQKLQQRAAEIVVTLTSGLSETRSALSVLADVPVDPPGSPAIFEQAAGRLVTGAVRLVDVVEPSGDDFIATVVVGDGVTTGSTLTGERASLARRAIATNDVVSTVLHNGTDLRVGFGFATADRTRVVMRETIINPGATVQTLRNQPFGDVDVALYASTTADPNNLVLKTTNNVPLVGQTVSQTVTIGADKWLVVSRSRGSLVTGFARNAPWWALIAGFVLALLLGALVETLSRRRRYALALVEDRTTELRSALQEQIRLEGEARQASAAAAAANQSKSEFLSRMSHELRTPLNAVLGFAQLLELEPLAQSQQEAVSQITKGGRHLLDLINEVLDITRIETGDLSLSPEAVLADDVLSETFELVQPLAREGRINMIGNRAGTCDVYVFADRQRLKQILLNLLSNAIKYNRAGGSVSVQCEQVGNRLRINVIDTGHGIHSDNLDRLFVPFERLGAERGDVEGTGIGLALSRRLAQAMGGEIAVESTFGRGSTFTVELPVVEGPVERYHRLAPATAQPAAADRQEATQTIVYIEDNLSNLRLVERILERRGGIELVAAMQGRLGLDLARQHRPLAVILDLHLPDIDGEDVLHELRDDPATASTPVIILSADATPGQLQRLLSAGARAYFTKPLDVRELLALIEELLDESAAARPS